MASAIHITMTGDERNAYQAMQRLIDQQAKMQASIGNTAKASKDAGGSLADAFGSSALTSLTSYAAGLASLGTVIGIVKQALSDLKKAREDAAGRNAANELGFASLGELAGGDPAKHRRLIEQAKSIYRQGGAKDQDAAARLTYQLESADVPQSWRDKAHMLFPTITEPDKLIGGITTIRKAMGEEEAGSFDQLYSKAVIAGSKTQQSASQMLTSTSRTAATGKALGLHDEELLAATSILAGTTGSSDEGATQVDAFLHSVIEGKAGKFKPGTPLAEIIKTLDKKGYSNQQLEKLLGRKESFSGFVGLRDRMGDYQQQLADIDAGNANPDAMERIFKSNMQQGELNSALQQRIGKAQTDVATMDMGAKHAIYEAAKSEHLNKMRKAGRSDWRIWFEEQAMDFKSWADEDAGERQMVRDIRGKKGLAEYDRIGAATAAGQTMDVKGDPIRGPVGGDNSAALIQALNANTAATAENTRRAKNDNRLPPSRILEEPPDY